MKLQSMTALAMSLLATPLWAVDGQLGLFFDTYPASCAMNVPCNCRGTLYVYAILQGASATGLSGAEYKIATGSTAADPGWFFSETFVPGALVLGSGALNPADPFTRGVNV